MQGPRGEIPGVSLSSPLKGTPPCRRGLSLAVSRGWGRRGSDPRIGDLASDFPSHLGGGAERSRHCGRHGRGPPGGARGASPALAACAGSGSSRDSSPVGFAGVETSLKWLCASKLQFQSGTPPLVLLTSPLTSAQFTLTPRNPRFCTELCRGSEYTTDYKEHSSGFSQGPSFPFL